jgi:hypothetical protein
MFVKICGMNSEEAVAAAVRAGADAIGFVFAESPREVTPERAKALCQHLPGHVVRVAVMRHPQRERWQQVLDVFAPDWLQTDALDLPAIPLPTGCTALPVYRNGSTPADTDLPDRLLFEGAARRLGRGAGALARGRGDPCRRPHAGERHRRHSVRQTVGRGRVERCRAHARRERPREDRRVRGPRAGPSGVK